MHSKNAFAAGGLSSREAQERLRQYGPNAVPQERPRPLAALARQFWAPVPWMLEASFTLEMALARYTQAVIIAFLLVFNAALSFFQERRADSALALLRRRLGIQARVIRDGRWQVVPSENLVPGDVIHLRMGDLVPADLRVLEGQVLLDQSALTGESAPVEAGAGKSAYAGAVVKRGEATGLVTATGARSYFGKAAELVRVAKTRGHLEGVILSVVKYLVAMDGLVVAAVLAYALLMGIALTDILPFALILLVASVPVALPATFTLATALGSHELAARGVLVTHLAAVEEAAAMDVLCSDKTGTITRNELALAGWRAPRPHTEEELLRLAALACDEATQDPIDLAILAAARRRGLLKVMPERVRLIPFDPATKRSEAVVRHGEANGEVMVHVVKGAPAVIAPLATGVPEEFGADLEQLAGGGYRVLAVAAGPEGNLSWLGLLGLQDPPRKDSRSLIRSLQGLGVRVLMVTGDGLATARTVASEVGIAGPACQREELQRRNDEEILGCSVFAGVFPEDKFRLVEALQHGGHVVGMTGDGVNDAPALKQAEVGVAVTNATDVAKAAASLVLTTPGLTNVLAAVETGRRIYQRMLTYTLNKIVKTFQVALFLGLGLLWTGVFVTTARQILLLLFANDFVTMSLSTDRVSFSRRPDRWNIRTLSVSALVLAAAWLVFAFGVFFVGRDALHLSLPPLQTLSFLMLVFTGQATVYLVRERRHFWSSRPGQWLALSSILDVLAVGFLATQGVLMAPVSAELVAGLVAAVVAFMILLDFLKIAIFRKLNLH